MKKGEETVTLTKDEYDKLKSFEDQLAELKRLVFGSKSERFISTEDADQLALFQQGKQVEDTSSQSITYERKKPAKDKKQPVRVLLPAHLPREEEIIEPEGLVEGVKKIGEEVTEILEHIPGKLYVRRIVRPKYVADDQDRSTNRTTSFITD